MPVDTIPAFLQEKEPIPPNDLETLQTIRTWLLENELTIPKKLGYSEETKAQFRTLVNTFHEVSPTDLNYSTADKTRKKTYDFFEVPEKFVPKDGLGIKSIAIMHYLDDDVWKISYSITPQKEQVKEGKKGLGNTSVNNPERITLCNFFFSPTKNSSDIANSYYPDYKGRFKYSLVLNLETIDEVEFNNKKHKIITGKEK